MGLAFIRHEASSMAEPPEIFDILVCIALLGAGEKIKLSTSQKCW